MALTVRVRSPNYPAMGLPEAIDRVRSLYDRLQHLSAGREAVASYLGYNGLNGSSMKVMSALLKYGLVEKTKDDKRKVSNLAQRILHPKSASEKSDAIKEAAFKPAIFAQIAEDWPGALPNVDSLTGYLRRKSFAADAIPELITHYRETIELVAAQSGGYKDTAIPQERSAPEVSKLHIVQGDLRATSQVDAKTAVSTDAPYRVSFTPNGMEIMGNITNVESADALIATINALKMLLKKQADDLMTTAQPSDEDEETS